MPSPLTTAGAQIEEPPKYVPLHVNRWWTGLWTNRSLLRDAASTYLIEKFYAGARFESMLAGQNIELSPRLTPIRRPGNSIYNSQTFPAILDFYGFRIFDTKTFAESIKVIADTASTVYDATGPNTKNVILAKAAGATQTSFQSLGNTLYMADGVENKKLVIRNRWQPNTTYVPGDSVMDSNNNLEKILAVFVGGTNISVQLDGGASILTIQFDSAPFDPPGPNIPLGTLFYLNLTTFTTFNLIPLTLATISIVNLFGPARSRWTLTFSATGSNYGPTADTGQIFNTDFTSGISSATEPTWSTTVNGLTIDNSGAFAILWQMIGPLVLDWQPVGPTVAPTVVNIANPGFADNWAASTFFNPSLSIADSNSNLQLLTTSGTTGGSPPTWSTTPGNTTNDGSAVWTCKGTLVRATNHGYSIGDLIQVTYTVTVVTSVPGQGGGGNVPIFPVQDGGTQVITLGPYTDIFKCTRPGNSSASATSAIPWASGAGSVVTDGTVQWQNQGPSITRTASATSTSNIGNSTPVSLLTRIVDKNGNFENLYLPGKSGTVEPTWATTTGSVTTETSGPSWQNGGPATVANTAAQVYGFAYKNSITGGISQCSPKSIPITLAQTSLISITGQGDPNWQTDGVDTIEIYRSTQGHTTLFWIADIPAPANGATWSYVDNGIDPPNPQSTLNEFISADVTGVNAPPPAGLTNLSYYLNRVWGSVGSIAYYSSSPNQSIGVNTDNWPGSNFFQLPSTISKFFPSTSGIIFFTNQGLYISVGVDVNGNPNQPVPFLHDIGLLSPNCFSINGSNPMLFTGDRQFILLDPGAGVSRVGFPIEDLLQQFNPTTSYVTWHTKGGDQAAYISDGLGNWFRVNLTPAPETGSFSWSPEAHIQGGASCIKSIEVSPGVKELLLGPPASTGPILKRDSTVNTDNGTPYPADFTVGNIVAAQPGQAAEFSFITTEEVNYANTPVSMSILADEISGSFDSFPTSVNDPPWATPSTSVISLRWYFGDINTPAWMRHFQLKFAWPAEDKKAELLTYSPVGAIHMDFGG